MSPEKSRNHCLEENMFGPQGIGLPELVVVLVCGMFLITVVIILFIAGG
jgi:hypothetical protein